ncbi:hypothetical protein NQ317_018410 [Molorchus minor]|uniref:Reverse transcriptase domain-containing protein n=1 Tax=Molorchus minor TaxID=1323400 RepID=A0ABQ9JRE2_9CUCU|nr:hypothetical protein NQ317_018410 [Molorchus minor]
MINQILPEENIRIASATRIGKPNLQNNPRPLRVILPTSGDVISTLKNELQNRIKSGEANITIKYVKNVPRIVPKAVFTTTDKSKRGREEEESPKRDVKKLGTIYFKPSLDLTVALESFQIVLAEITEIYNNVPIILLGDYNCRVSELGTIPFELLQDTNLNENRSSRDKILNTRGRMIVEFMYENSFSMLNGRTKSDTPAQFTHIAERGKSVIDLVWINNSNLNSVYDMLVTTDYTISDHFALAVSLNFDINRQNLTNSVINNYSIPSLRWSEDVSLQYKILMQRSHQVGYLSTLQDSYINMSSTITQVASSLNLKKYHPPLRESWKKNKHTVTIRYILVSPTPFLIVRFPSTRIAKWAESNSILPEAQSGFRKTRGCIDNVFVLSCIIQLQLRLKKRKVFVAFVDYKRAFDSINHTLLWQKLYDLGVSNRIILIIKNIYDKATLKVISTNGLTKSIDLTEGVLQGETLSPLLFSLFLSDIERYFMGKGARGVNVDNIIEVFMLLYADDLVLISDSEVDLQRKLNILEQYSDQNLLTVNADKTKILVTSRKSQNSASFNFYYKQNKIEVVNKYNYLGVVFSSSAVFREMAYRTAEKAKQASGSVIPIIAKAKLNSWDSKMYLFDSLVTSIVTNCIPAWGLRYTDVLERIQLAFLKRILLLPKNTADFAVRLETGRVKISYCVFRHTLNWLIKIFEMDNNRLPKICLLRLLYFLNTNEPKYNWMSQFREMLEYGGYTEQWGVISGALIKNKRGLLLANFRNNLRNEDITSLNQSSYLTIYRQLTLKADYQDYLKLNIPIHITRVIAQLRLCNEYHIKFNFKGYSYKINPKEHRAGTAHRNADALSRRPCPEDCKHCHKVEAKEAAVRRTTVLDDNWQIEKIKIDQENDPELKHIMTWKKEGRRPTWAEIARYSPVLKSYWAQWNSLDLNDGCLKRVLENGEGKEDRGANRSPQDKGTRSLARDTWWSFRRAPWRNQDTGKTERAFLLGERHKRCERVVQKVRGVRSQ